MLAGLHLLLTTLAPILEHTNNSDCNTSLCTRGGDGNLKVGAPIVLLFLLLHTNCTCGIIYVRVQRTDRLTESARSRLRVVHGVQKWGLGMNYKLTDREVEWIVKYLTNLLLCNI